MLVNIGKDEQWKKIGGQYIRISGITVARDPPGPFLRFLTTFLDRRFKINFRIKLLFNPHHLIGLMNVLQISLGVCLVLYRQNLFGM